MKRATRKAVSAYVKASSKRSGSYEYRGRKYKTKTQLKAAVTESMKQEAAGLSKKRRSVKPVKLTTAIIESLREQREEREQHSRLILRHSFDYEKPHYIAVCKFGFGISQKPWQAIRRAQEAVPLDAKPSQLVIYSYPEPIKPTGFIQWPNGSKPKLVGITNTHQGWQEAHR